MLSVLNESHIFQINFNFNRNLSLSIAFLSHTYDPLYFSSNTMPQIPLLASPRPFILPNATIVLSCAHTLDGYSSIVNYLEHVGTGPFHTLFIGLIVIHYRLKQHFPLQVWLHLL